MAPRTAKKKTEEVSVAAGNEELAILEHFNRLYGQNSITFLDQDTVSSVNEWVKTGSLLIDWAVSSGKGLPVGKVVTISGKKSSGKSTLAASLVATVQKAGGIAVWLDTELAFDKARAEQIGVDTHRLLVAQPESVERVIDQIQQIIKIAENSNRLILIVWDSVAATPTSAEIEAEELGQGGNYGEHSKLISKGLRIIIQQIAKHRVLLFLVNQIKKDLNSTYGDAATYIGKNPLDFHSHIMMEIKEAGKITRSNNEITGIESFLKISKNRVAPPFKEVTLRFDFASGIDHGYEIVKIGEMNCRVRKDGSWYCVIVPCSCGGADNNHAECYGTGLIQAPGSSKFYLADATKYFSDNPELEAYVETGKFPAQK